jgi:ABC-type sugar transport system ATPase subunit
MAKLKLLGVNKVFGRTEVLKDINLTINDGELLVLVGPSGCGKSTLLRCIAGLEQISSGELQIDGKRVNDLSPKDRDIAMVFQSYALYPHMTVRANLSFGLRIRKMPQNEIDSRVAEASQMLGLQDLLQRYPKELSGGQRQRVAMGRAIVRQPKVFLFDEPLSNLDAALRVQMRAELARLHRNLGVTMVYVTHDQVEAMTLADRIVVLRHGEIQQVGAPLELYHRPANQFVGGFIGSPAMNFIDGRVDDRGSNVQIHSLSFDMPGGQAALTAGQSLTVGIRPEHLGLADAGQTGLAGTVEVIEPLGAEAHVYLRLGDNGTLVVGRLTGGAASELKPGSPAVLSVSAEHLYLFDAKSGAAVSN